MEDHRILCLFWQGGIQADGSTSAISGDDSFDGVSTSSHRESINLYVKVAAKNNWIRDFVFTPQATGNPSDFFSIQV
jgi:hypothetical protein